MLCSSCGKEPKAGTKLKKCVCEKAFYCGVECQKSHWKSHRPNCPHFVIKDIPGKGWGMMAARKLKPGTVILSEAPLLTVEHPTPPTVTEELKHKNIFEDECAVAVLTAFDKLSEENKKKYLSLVDSAMIDRANLPGVVLGKYQTNGIGITENKTGVYYMISRINHSCSPNARAVQAIKENENLKEVRAYVQIEKGEEILISYINLEQFVQRDDRRNSLAKWNFLCSCKICSLTGEDLLRNEVTRKNIQENHLNMVKWWNWNRGIPVMSKMKALEFAQKKLESVLTIHSEMMGQVFASYLDCYVLTCAVVKEGGKIKTDPSLYSEKAKQIAQVMGYAFMEMLKDKVPIETT